MQLENQITKFNGKADTFLIAVKALLNIDDCMDATNFEGHEENTPAQHAVYVATLDGGPAAIVPGNPKSLNNTVLGAHFFLLVKLLNLVVFAASKPSCLII